MNERPIHLIDEKMKIVTDWPFTMCGRSTRRPGYKITDNINRVTCKKCVAKELGFKIIKFRIS